MLEGTTPFVSPDEIWQKRPSLFISKFVAGVWLCIKCKESFKAEYPLPVFTFVEAMGPLVLIDEVLLFSFFCLHVCLLCFSFSPNKDACFFFLLSGKLFLCVLCLFFYARDLFLSVLARAVVSSFHRHLYCLLLGTYFCCVFDGKLWIEPWWGCMHRNIFCLFSANLLEVQCLCFKYRFRFFCPFRFRIFFLFPPIFLVCIGPDSFIQPFVNSSNREGFGEVGAWMYVCGVCVCMYVFVCGRPTFGSGAEAALLRNNSFSRLK